MAEVVAAFGAKFGKLIVRDGKVTCKFRSFEKSCVADPTVPASTD
jgi:hypothetical protein